MLWFGLFMLSPVWAIIALACWVLLTIWDIEYERPGRATFWLLVVVGLIHFGGVFDVASFIGAHPLYALGGLAAYFPIGAAWAFGKFVSWLRKREEEIMENTVPHVRSRFLRDNNVQGEVIPDALKDAWEVFKKEDHTMQREKASLHPMANLGRLMMWAIWWPFSLVWTIINDPVKRAFKYLIVQVLGGALKRQYEKVWSRIERDA